jgi:hypothetical protein
MARYITTFLILTMAIAAPAVAQGGGHGNGNGEGNGHGNGNNRSHTKVGHIPSAPTRRPPNARPEPEHIARGRDNGIPHVSHDHWYGHASPGNGRYHLNQPFRSGRFGRVGPAYRYSIVRIDRRAHRFWIPGGYYFYIAPWEWPLVVNWCWDCGDDFVVYIDPDHPGWYLLYNTETGTYIHVQYAGM